MTLLPKPLTDAIKRALVPGQTWPATYLHADGSKGTQATHYANGSWIVDDDVAELTGTFTLTPIGGPPRTERKRKGRPPERGRTVAVGLAMQFLERLHGTKRKAYETLVEWSWYSECRAATRAATTFRKSELSRAYVPLIVIPTTNPSASKGMIVAANIDPSAKYEYRDSSVSIVGPMWIWKLQERDAEFYDKAKLHLEADIEMINRLREAQERRRG